MKRRLLLKIAGICVVALAGVLPSKAQNNTILGPRFIVNAPANIEGEKAYRPSNSGEATANDWGRAIDDIWANYDVVKPADSTGCVIAPNTLTGKFALIYRANCMFSEKAYNAQQAGAVAVIIVNNVPGQVDFIMSPGTNAGSVTIPVIIIPKEIGDAINAEINNSVNVKATLTNWGFGNANDLLLLSGAQPAYGAIPMTQTGSGNPAAYNFYNGAVIANTGTIDQTNVVVNAALTFTPTGGSPTNVSNNSTTAITFNVLDSIAVVSNQTISTHNTSSTGKYTLTYNVTGTNADDFAGDNTKSVEMHVTTNTFCKGRYDANTGKPIITGGNKFSSTTIDNYTWGPLYYVNQGGFRAERSQVAAFTPDTNQRDDMSVYNGGQFVCLFKWKDTVVVNKVIEPSELTMVGIASVNFPVNSPSGAVLNSNDFEQPLNPGNPVTLESNTWYWVAVVTANTSPGLFLGVDDAQPVYARAYAAQHQTTPIRENWQAQYFGGVDISSYTLDAGADTVMMYPFTNSPLSYYPIDSVGYSNTTIVPNVTLQVSQFPAEVKNITSKAEDRVSVYPNPAVDHINASVNFATKIDKVNFMIMNQAGQVVKTTPATNVQKGEYRISTEGLAQGQYYLITNTGTEVIVKNFNVISK